MVKPVFRAASRIDEAHPARPLGFIGLGSSPASPSSEASESVLRSGSARAEMPSLVSLRHLSV